MKHYKYSRNNLYQKYETSAPMALLEDLFTTISKEEYSQRIMMEQVPKDKPKEDLVSDCCGSDFDAFGRTDENGNPAEVCNKCHKACDVHWGIVGKPKQQKPVCEHKLSNIETHDQDGTFHINGDTCSKCGKHILDWDNPKPTSIEDTNKTSLEVPKDKSDYFCGNCTQPLDNDHICKNPNCPLNIKKAKQELKVPDKLGMETLVKPFDKFVSQDNVNYDFRNKINELIDYLTLISLDKK